MPTIEYIPSKPKPMGWDLEAWGIRLFVSWLAETGADEDTVRKRRAAARVLVEVWEKRRGTPPNLVDILTAWWLAAREVCDVADSAGHPRHSPSFVFQKVMSLNAMEFADALGISVANFVETMAEIGFPHPPMEEEMGIFKRPRYLH